MCLGVVINKILFQGITKFSSYSLSQIDYPCEILLKLNFNERLELLILSKIYVECLFYLL